LILHWLFYISANNTMSRAVLSSMATPAKATSSSKSALCRLPSAVCRLLPNLQLTKKKGRQFHALPGLRFHAKQCEMLIGWCWNPWIRAVTNKSPTTMILQWMPLAYVWSFCFWQRILAKNKSRRAENSNLFPCLQKSIIVAKGMHMFVHIKAKSQHRPTQKTCFIELLDFSSRVLWKCKGNNKIAFLSGILLDHWISNLFFSGGQQHNIFGKNIIEMCETNTMQMNAHSLLFNSVLGNTQPWSWRTIFSVFEYGRWLQLKNIFHWKLSPRRRPPPCALKIGSALPGVTPTLLPAAWHWSATRREGFFFSL